MDKIIPLNKGIRRQPSLGEEGELSELVGLVPKNGELVNVKPMKAMASIDEGDVLMGVHNAVGREVYLFANGNVMKFRTLSEGVMHKFSDDISLSSTIKKIEIIGNNIAVVTEGGDEFLLLRGDKYESLGNGLPEIPISFGLQTTLDSITKIPTIGGINEYEVVEDGYYVEHNGTQCLYKIADTSIENVMTGIKDSINIMIGDKAVFMYPFLVRCAYKMLNKHIKSTPPVLMQCTTGSPYYLVSGVKWTENADGSYFCSANGDATCYLHYSELDFGLTEELDLYAFRDIIESIDVFISPLINTDTDNKINPISLRPVEVSHNSPISVCKVGDRKYQYTEKSTILSQKYQFNYEGKGDVIWEGECISDEDFKEKVRNSSTFYKICSIKLSDLPEYGERKKVEVSKATLDALTEQELLEDSHERELYTSRQLLSYNNRLIRVGNTRRYYDGVNIQCALPYMNGDAFGGDGKQEDDYYYVQLTKDNEVIIVGGSVNKGTLYSFADNGLRYFAYPDEDVTGFAFRVRIEDQNRYAFFSYGKDKIQKALGFSYIFNCGRNLFSNEVTVTEPSVKNNEIDEPNIISFSDVNNPYVFDKMNKIRVTFGEIKGIETSAKALSQGQFGQFPLYAFCSDGIWALEVASDGTFNSKQPISRDVCNNADSITQIDGAVVFTTDQGLKLIQGSEVTLLSGAMDGHNVDERAYFPEDFFAKKGYGEYDNLVVQETRDFRRILETCRIAYDYPNNMLRIFPKDKVDGVYKYYVYDLTTGEYGSAIEGEEVSTVVPSYPTSMLQKGASVFTFDNVSDNDTLRQGLLLTRPVMFSEPSSLKKINELKLHYTKHHEDTKVRMVMYVSNDSKNWVEVKSLRHGSYKYYRFGLVTNMTDDDALSGMVARYEITRTNKLR